MRILIECLTLEQTGGMEQHARELVYALTELGHDVRVWSYLQQPEYQDLKEVNIEYLMPKNRISKSLHYRWRALWIMLKVLFKTDEVDLIIVQHPMLAVGTYLASLVRSKPYWVWTHGRDLWMEWPHLLYNSLKNADHIIAPSEFCIEKVNEKLPEANTVLIRYPVDTSRFRSISNHETINTSVILLTVGRIGHNDRRKGHDMVIKALAKVKKMTDLPFKYQIVGSGALESDLKELARQYDVDDIVEFLGWKSGEELVRFYQDCNIFIMPSRVVNNNGQLSGEGFGIVYIEAAACAKPVIGSNQGGGKDAVVHNETGFAVDPLSVEEVSEAIYKLISNPTLAKNMGEKGLSFVEKQFSEQAFRKRLNEMLDEYELTR